MKSRNSLLVALSAVTAIIVSTNVSADAAGDYAAGCFACHSPATAAAVGAPGVGDKTAWAPRIAKGMDALYATAINGSPTNPLMMPRGGTGLSDDALKAVVDYMVAQSK
ncbi:MAG: c-type cytochrome [Gammaproteobacteria bacterium]|uniref:C-type cytochrome n=1 Tax=Candidatus Thiopontia autotrophica TaxID=2841688 RepID=A0A8J6NX65_9GAMM|nr:c-type cytochrome [Candidatus Thiopontia autotrophica]MBL6968679.1 c-type cytochrome [Gammaproteobacteria bacterium]